MALWSRKGTGGNGAVVVHCARRRQSAVAPGAALVGSAAGGEWRGCEIGALRDENLRAGLEPTPWSDTGKWQGGDKAKGRWAVQRPGGGRERPSRQSLQHRSARPGCASAEKPSSEAADAERQCATGIGKGNLDASARAAWRPWCPADVTAQPANSQGREGRRKIRAGANKDEYEWSRRKKQGKLTCRQS